MSFNDKTVLITGANSGIGKEIALMFGKEHANVLVNYIVNEQDADDVVQAIKEMGGNAKKVFGDVTKLENCKTLVEEGITTFGAIDILINNSGITRDNLIMRMKEEDFDQVIDVNLKGTWNMSKAITRHFMKQRVGRIINISSVVGIIGNAGQSNYAASKAGIIGLTKSLAKELGKRNVTVNAVAPGFIQTKMTKELPEEVKKDYYKQIPLGRFGTTKDIANACLFLAGNQASYITGQVLSVNGGMI
ncbi:MAG: 3-oxoacyl-[acyl-carrier-protein] reductase [Candidatus Izimaplasma sp.]|nr:3-oxoacyl-[acyl-carrier-protein] reductase [Candidatus Izimaplasma bacterium]